MDQAQLKAIESRCTQEAPPRCRAACPFRLDTRAFMKQIAAGQLAEARKTLEKHLPLPGILARICDHPCEGRCLRRDLGGSLALGALEKWCVDSVGAQTKPFPRPPKAARLAVLGSGLAGLTVAFELSRKAFPVTVFHEGEVEAVLCRRFPELEAGAIADELERLRKAGTLFEAATLTATLQEQVQETFDAVFVDADAAGVLAEGVQTDTVFWAGGTVCCAGGLDRTPTGAVFASASRQAGEGRSAAITLERLMTGVSLTAVREGETDTETRLYTPLEGIAVIDRVLPETGTYTLTEASSEASRCLHCECLACVRECAYLQKYRGYPRTHARQIHNNASIVKGLHTANALINGCALCGQCTAICPERFSMAELCLSARQDMVARGFMPPSAHEFALEDMESANGPECALFRGDPDLPDGTPVSDVFFPGCQLAASRGEQVLAVYALLREQLGAVGLFLSCCGVPAHWAGDESRFRAALEPIRQAWEDLGRPRLIVACASCLKTFREALPDIPLVSLWEILAQHRFSPPEAVLPARCSIHDPCAAREDADWQNAVRQIAHYQGILVEEPRLTGRQTACCGYGGLLWNAQPELAEAMTAHRAEELPYPVLASCVMCRDRLVASGKACWHVLDVLPLGEPHDPLEKGPGLSARRTQRAALRRRALAVCWHDKEPEGTLPFLEIAPDLLEALERKHILREDVEQAIRGLEVSGGSFQERQSGHFIGSWRPRNVTFWVRYSTRDGLFVLHDAWCHRMIVPGADAPSNPICCGGSA